MFNSFTHDKASSNISFLDIFKRKYKEDNNEDIYTISCVAHTLNNVVQDILKELLFDTNTDDSIIYNTIKEDIIYEEDIIEDTIRKFSLIIFLIILKEKINNVTTLSSEGRLGSGIDLLERSVKDGIGRLRARLVWYNCIVFSV